MKNRGVVLYTDLLKRGIFEEVLKRGEKTTPPLREATASPHVQITQHLCSGFSPPECGNSNAGNYRGRDPFSMDLLTFNPIWSALQEDLTLPLLFTPAT